ncbi:MAG: plasmid pRiA4b family protein [Hydrocarboniphaga sp.]|uniref:plasmid pRiA4b ORF-3 family protein n=1 Tax=Hydrocarboniphaga sp. TaxID=2033016 RepID=UPI00262A6324|nr:plasmid pRiA4b ORF-3 family protein [Hydrocarboniphaga sp.]MDB5973074.1 plasmid pRiA4b family protein [Hydrocarboniphaga sp.]
MPATHHLKIVLKNTDPSIWRELAVPSDLRLDRLHDVIQIVMGWEDDHLHEFSNGVRGPGELRFGIQDDEFDDGLGPALRDEKKGILSDFAPRKGSKFRYWYDFGDDWVHEITVKAIGAAEPGAPEAVCLKAAGACPPEDCGGPWGYMNLLTVLADPAHEEYEELREWVGSNWDPQRYDIVAANKALTKLAARWRRPAPRLKASK